MLHNVVLVSAIQHHESTTHTHTHTHTHIHIFLFLLSLPPSTKLIFHKGSWLQHFLDDENNSRPPLTQIVYDQLKLEPKVSSFVQKANGQNMRGIFGDYPWSHSYLSSWNIEFKYFTDLYTTVSASKMNFTTYFKPTNKT